MGNNSNIASNYRKFPKLYAFWIMLCEYCGDYFSGRKHRSLYNNGKTK